VAAGAAGGGGLHSGGRRLEVAGGGQPTRWTSRYEAVHGEGDAESHHGGSNIVADGELRTDRRTANSARAGGGRSTTTQERPVEWEMAPPWEVGGGGGWRRRGAVRQGWGNVDGCGGMDKGMTEWVVPAEV
jgi:hypothetical protein